MLYLCRSYVLSPSLSHTRWYLLNWKNWLPRDLGGGYITTRVLPRNSTPRLPQGCTTPPRSKARRTIRLAYQWYDVRPAIVPNKPPNAPSYSRDYSSSTEQDFIIVIPWYHSSWNKYFCWFRMYYFYYLYAKTQKARTCLECTTTFVTAQTSLVWCTWWACTQPKHILPMLFTLPSQIWLVCEFVASLVWCHRRNKHQGMFLCS